MTRQTLLIGSLLAPALGAFAAAAELPQGLKPLSLADGWVGRAAGSADLRDRAVIVDVFTYGCINCIHVLPNLKRLYTKYSRSDLAVVGVHTPEVPSYQSQRSYLESQTADAGIEWPIAIDNGNRIWNAYGISAWPTLLVFDRSGVLSATIVGDGTDTEVDSAVRAAVGHTG